MTEPEALKRPAVAAIKKRSKGLQDQVGERVRNYPI